MRLSNVRSSERALKLDGGSPLPYYYKVRPQPHIRGRYDKVFILMRTPLIAMNDVQRSWYVVDAEGKTLGRLATRIARVLTGKHKATYTPNADTGDFVVVVNAEKVHLTGKKWSDKIYYRHSQYPGGLRERTAGQVRDAHPTRVIETAVRGMLPGNRLRAKRMTRLRLFVGPNHEHAAQAPQPMKEV